MFRKLYSNIKVFTGFGETLYTSIWVQGSEQPHRGFINPVTFIADYIEQKTKGDFKKRMTQFAQQCPGAVLKPNNPAATSVSFGRRINKVQPIQDRSK